MTKSLPDGWHRPALADVASVNPARPEKLPGADDLVSFIPMAAVEAMTGRIDTTIARPWRAVTKGYTRFQDGDVLVAKITPSMENGKAALAKGLLGGVGAGSTEFHVIRPTAAVLAEYLLYYVLREDFRKAARASMTGTAGQLRVPAGFLEGQLLPLPPVPEQRRLVDSIESFLTRLDDTAATCERVRHNLRRYRASVLIAAVEGCLVPTEAQLAREKGRDYEPSSVLLERILVERRRRWEAAELARMKARGRPPQDDKWKSRYKEPVSPDRSNRPELPDGWCWATVDQLSYDVRYGTSARCLEQIDAGIPVVRMGNIVDGVLVLDGVKYLPAHHREFPDLYLQPGDILFNRTNSAELVGKTAVYRGQPDPCSFASYLIRVRCLAGIQPVFLAHYINSAAGRKWISSVVSQQVGQANVNGTKLKACAVPLPPSAEQTRIVARCEGLLSLADKLGHQLRTCGERNLGLRQSVLKWAFEGRLVDQDLTDEPASALLERARAERAAGERAGSASRKRRRTTPHGAGRGAGGKAVGMTRGVLPNAEDAIVPRTKIVDYLLSKSHPDGRGKERFFTSHGFSLPDWEGLAAALAVHARAHPVIEAVETAFGMRYVIEGGLVSPDGRTPVVRTVWFIRKGRDVPELVTAYPVKRR